MAKNVLKKYRGSNNIGTWSEWSVVDKIKTPTGIIKKGNFPADVLEMVELINREQYDKILEHNPKHPASYDKHHTYGFKIAFYMFMEGWSQSYTEKYFQVTYFGYQVLYPTKM